MLRVSDEHHGETPLEKGSDGRWRERVHLHQPVYDDHLWNDVLDSALAQRLVLSRLRARNPPLLRLAVEAKSLVLPVLVQSGFEVSATFVPGEAESFRLLRLLDGEMDKLRVRSSGRRVQDS